MVYEYSFGRINKERKSREVGKAHGAVATAPAGEPRDTQIRHMGSGNNAAKWRLLQLLAGRFYLVYKTLTLIALDIRIF